MTTSSSTIINHILASYPERITRCGVIDISLSIISLFTAHGRFLGLRGVHINKYSSVHSNITRSIFLNKNYQNHNEINEAYNDFIQKIMSVIDKVAPVKERRVKQNSQEWFDGEIVNGIKNRDKLFKKFKKSKLHIDKDIYNAARYKVRKMIFDKKRSFFLEKKIK